VRGQELPTAYVRAKFEDRSFFRLRNIEGVPKFRNWVTYPRRRPLRVNLWSMGKNCPRPMCVPNLKIVALPVCKILRGPKISKLGHVPRPRPISGQFATAYVRAKFEDRSFFRLRNIERVPKFRNWVTYPRPRPLRGQFVVRGKNCPRPMCVPNLKGVALSVCEILAHFTAVH